eukprot:6781628-Prymnesium_polylepis.2
MCIRDRACAARRRKAATCSVRAVLCSRRTDAVSSDDAAKREVVDAPGARALLLDQREAAQIVQAAAVSHGTSQRVDEVPRRRSRRSETFSQKRSRLHTDPMSATTWRTTHNGPHPHR